MPVPDDTLIDAMADAAEGRGVLVVTPLASETDGIVARAKAITVKQLTLNADFTREEAQAFILVSPNPWQVRLKSRGWVFFFPVHDLKPNDDVGNPSYVYSLSNKGAYEKLPYGRWRSLQVVPPTPEETQQAQADATAEPKSLWSRLMEDDD